MIATLAAEAAHRATKPAPDNDAWFDVAFQRLLVLDQFSGGEDDITTAFRNAMVHYYTRGDFSRALTLAERGLEIVEARGWPKAQHVFHHNAAVMLKSIGDSGRAISHLASALELAKSLADPVAECRTWGQLASTVLDSGQFADVIRYSRRGLAIAAPLGEKAREIRAQCNQLIAEASLHLMAELEERQRHLAEGLVTITNAVHEYGEPKTDFERLQIAKFWLTKTQLLVRAGHIEEAKKAALKCKDMANATGNAICGLKAEIALAMVEGAEGHCTEAKQTLKQLLARHQKRDDVRADMIAGLVFVQERSGDAPGAAHSRAELYESWQRKHIAGAFRVLEEITRRYPIDESQFLNAATQEAIETIALIGELHDDDTGTHVYRVGSMASMIAHRLGWTEDQARQLEFAARLHDIGKIAIHSDIMLAPRALSPVERAEMQKHTVIGTTILSRVIHPVMAVAAQIAGAHHEHWDGSGYPHGLAGQSIPMAARITAVADVFDALTHSRCYKQAWTYAAAIEEISRGRGTKFDPEVVDAFIGLAAKLLAELGADGLETKLSEAASENQFNAARELLTTHAASLK